MYGNSVRRSAVISRFAVALARKRNFVGGSDRSDGCGRNRSVLHKIPVDKSEETAYGFGGGLRCRAAVHPVCGCFDFRLPFISVKEPYKKFSVFFGKAIYKSGKV